MQTNNLEGDYLSKYNYKLKTPEELGHMKLESNGTTIMCHGVFDVVHPGHLRHLAYAKTKADKLIVSVTSDSHIKKGTYRPHVPENLRALNLAALEMVDFVVIDSHETPINNLMIIKPDFFAKGFEYNNSGLTPATAEELELVTNYGGQVIFTPGDFILSSSALISESAPDLKFEKFLSMMQTHDIRFIDLYNALNSLTSIEVHVVGDTIIDTFVNTALLGGQTKTPTISVKYLNEKKYLGGAAVVAKHLQAAGAKVTFTTLLGKDKESEEFHTELQELGILMNVVSEINRPTTEKKVIICDKHRLLKIDTVENTPCLTSTINEISRFIQKTHADIVIFSDFRHGIFHKLSIPILSNSIPSKAMKVADSQVASRWGNISEFVKFDLLTPNEKEARFSLGDQDSTIGLLGNKLFEESKCKNLILKLGARGAIGFMGTKNQKNPQIVPLDSFTQNAVDPVGAGDALIAYASLALKATNSLPIAIILGSLAAACETEIDGNEPISKEIIETKLKKLENSVSYNFE